MTSSPKHDTLKLYNTSTAASLHRAPSLLRTMFRHLLADASEMEIYLAFITAAVSRNAWYEFTASGTDMVLNQSTLRPWTFGTVSKSLHEDLHHYLGSRGWAGGAWCRLG